MNKFAKNADYFTETTAIFGKCYGGHDEFAFL